MTTPDSKPTRNVSVMSLFDVENVAEMPKVRDMTVGPVSTADVREFARRYHYTGAAGNVNARWGLWHNAVLHGVIAYNLLSPRASEFIMADAEVINLWHMARLILSEESPRNSESRLIGGSLKAIEREYPHVWAVVTYADTARAHIGTVYQATNALYTGLGGEPVYYSDADGARRSHRCNGGSIHRDQAEQMGLTRHVGPQKHRYVYILGSKTQRRQRRRLLKLDVLPYPKHGGVIA